jgi:hypothetical protein
LARDGLAALRAQQRAAQLAAGKLGSAS